MVSIRDLSTTPSFGAGDLVPIASGQLGVDAKATGAQILAFISSSFASPEFRTLINAPTSSGTNIQIGAQTENIWQILNPTGAFAALTITLPPVASCFDGQQIIVTSSEPVTALTVSGNGALVYGAPVALGDGGFFALRFNALQGAWYCVSQSLGAGGGGAGSMIDANGNIILGVVPEYVFGDTTRFPLMVARGSNDTPIITVDGVGGDINLKVMPKENGSLILEADAGDIAVISEGGEIEMRAQNGITVRSTDLGVSVQAETNINIIANSGDIHLSTTRSVRWDVMAVAELPTAGESMGGRAVVADSNAALTAGIGAVVVGGGGNIVPVFCDGSNWRIG
jgi:hypothetical protein